MSYVIAGYLSVAVVIAAYVLSVLKRERTARSEAEKAGAGQLAGEALKANGAGVVRK